MSMQKPRLADLNLVYKMHDIMLANGFTATRYKVLDSYPDMIDLDTDNIWPTVVVEMGPFFGRDVEIGSSQWPAMMFFIDILAKTDGQRDDLSYLIWNTLNEGNFTFYDFNSGFPTIGASVDYSGITTIGQFVAENLSITPLDPPGLTNIDGEKHHSIIDGIMLLSNN